jgi:hypothetical protein
MVMKLKILQLTKSTHVYLHWFRKIIPRGGFSERRTIMKTSSKIQLCRLIYYFLSALRVSTDVFVYRQGDLTVFTVSGNIHKYRCRLVS